MFRFGLKLELGRWGQDPSLYRAGYIPKFEVRRLLGRKVAMGLLVLGKIKRGLRFSEFGVVVA